jgi:putative copper resistance protein D
METLIDIFGFASVLLHGLELIAQSALIGGIVFLLALALPLAPRLGPAPALAGWSLRALRVAAVAVILVALLATGLSGAVLAGSLGLGWREVAGAGFVAAGAARALVAVALLLLLAPPGAAARVARPWARGLLALLAAALLAAALAESHAAARLGDRGMVLAATGLHQLGAAVWLGGLPWFLAALRLTEGAAASAVGRRYSHLSVAGVGCLLASAGLFLLFYIGSPDGLYGTAYGAMAGAKSVLMGLLLLLGLGNFIAVRRFADGAWRLRAVRRAVELEIGIGLAVLMAAASITSLPPAVDLAEDRATGREILERLAPTLPRLESPDHGSLSIPALQARLDAEWQADQAKARPQAFTPGAGAVPPRNAEDIAWSEYNHHWAGLMVLAMGLLALAERLGARWAAHWPLIFLAMAGFIFVRGDPEVWPLGDIGLIESLKDPEVVQHRIFSVMAIAFALFEWAVRTGRVRAQSPALVFPALIALGGTLLLTHSHALGNVKEQLLVEYSHLPIGILGITAGWSRWLQVRAAAHQDGAQPLARGAGWVWPVCFALIGALLLFYREA